MAFCSQCGTPFESGTAFCQNCGAAVTAAPQTAFSSAQVPPTFTANPPASAVLPHDLTKGIVGLIVSIVYFVIMLVQTFSSADMWLSILIGLCFGGVLAAVAFAAAHLSKPVAWITAAPLVLSYGINMIKFMADAPSLYGSYDPWMMALYYIPYIAMPIVLVARVGLLKKRVGVSHSAVILLAFAVYIGVQILSSVFTVFDYLQYGEPEYVIMMLQGSISLVFILGFAAVYAISCKLCKLIK